MGEGRKQERKHLLVLRYPNSMFRVWRGGKLLLPGDIFLQDELGGRSVEGTIKVAHHAGSPDMREHLRPPDKEVLPVKFLGDGVAKRGDGGEGHGDGDGGG